MHRPSALPGLATLSLVLTFIVSLPAAAQAPDQGGHRHGAAVGGGVVPLYDDLGDHARRVTTASEKAQAYFNQGLRLQYGFNHPEALRSYRAALAADPECAMCWWGIALAAGPNINAPMSEESGHEAWNAIINARRLSRDASSVERDLIEALAHRYAADPAADRAPLDSAYARAMGRLAQRYPDDADIQTLYGAARMNLSPWNYWDGDFGARTPRAGTETLVRTLERAVAMDPDHPGACHYYIHAVEAAHPERALPCAERLASLMPGAGHIVHMPGHIYVRVGRYADAVRANDHAVHSDEIRLPDLVGGLYAAAYYPHNYHFMAFAATMAGMSEKAIEAARKVAPLVPVAVAKQIYWIQNAVVLPHLTLVSFGKWEEILAEPMPSEELGLSTTMAWYARGVAHAALGQAEAARGALARLESMADVSGRDPATNPIPTMAPMALAGEIALREGRAEEAVRHFQAAVAVEDGLLYEEPPLWYYPMRQSLGRALIEAGRPDEAEAVYRAELAKFPENGWSLYGLAKALEVQGRSAEAREVRTRFKEAWKHADVALTASRF